MTSKRLREEIDIELHEMQVVVDALKELEQRIGNTEPDIFQNAATMTFFSQFYMGVENILKRISRFCNVPLPQSGSWHAELLLRFGQPSYQGLPALFDDELLRHLAPYRKFRHVVMHNYTGSMDWQQARRGIQEIQHTFTAFQQALLVYVASLA
jgi:hypothetical protein